MANKSPQKNTANLRRVLVAGDVCLDVVAVPLPAKSTKETPTPDNWRLTRETRMHFLPGGAMLLAKFIRASRMVELLAKAEKRAQEEIAIKQKLAKLDPDSDELKKLRCDIRDEARRAHIQRFEDEVIGPRPRKPAKIAGKRTSLYQDDFIGIAERLQRDEIIHSLVEVDLFQDGILRVRKKHGYSGPDDSKANPSLKLDYPQNVHPDIIVLDDTGNRFRRKDPDNPWPAVIDRTNSRGQERPLIVYKLHRPLPCARHENPLWNVVTKKHQNNRVVIVSVDDLRAEGAPISLGLSWERTALDVVWHLLHFEGFAALRDCPWLIVRLGLDGAVLWHGPNNKDRQPRAWLTYDPVRTEGDFALEIPGKMVSAGSAFTAAFVQCLATGDDPAFSALLKPLKGTGRKSASLANAVEELILKAVHCGLQASRRLLRLGFGTYKNKPNYPGPDLFEGSDRGPFFDQCIPIIPGANEPDRSYWRLLESIFESKPNLLQTAVNLTATKRNVGTNDVENAARKALKGVPKASYGNLKTHDRCEIEYYRALHTLLRDYLCARKTQRPLSIGVFGAPGAGKSFGVKEVAASLKGQRDCREVESLTFNLSLYQGPEELAGAFHLVRDVALRGKVPLVFFDEFDTSLKSDPLGWLRHFLSPMQDGEFLDRGAPHPIGQAIFVFAGGTCSTFREFANHDEISGSQFKALKGPDFLSRLRATLDIPSLNFSRACEPVIENGKIIQPSNTFNPHGPIEAFPCEAAILLRRASILAFNLPKKAPDIVLADGSLCVAHEVLRTLLYLPCFNHGNRSFEAILDMSHLSQISEYTPSLLPAPFQLPLHVDARQIEQLVMTPYPLLPAQRLAIAKAIHRDYQIRKRRVGNVKPNDRSLKNWDAPLDDDLKQSNLEQVDDIANKLRSVGLWLRKKPRVSSLANRAFAKATETHIQNFTEKLAKAEHDRWVAQKRKQGWAAGPDTSESSKIDEFKLHNCIFPWDRLSKKQKELDLGPIRNIPKYLAAAGFEVVSNNDDSSPP